MHYVALSGPPDAVRQAAPELRPALRTTKLLKGDFFLHLAPSGRWAVAGFHAPDRLCRQRVAVEGDAILAINGSALSATDEQPDLARTLLARFRKGGTGSVIDALGGSYNVVAACPEIGFCAFPDFPGLHPLYYGHRDDLAVVSNRSTTVGHLLGAGEWDLRAMAWLIANGSLFGPTLPTPGVQPIEPGCVASAALGDDHLRLGPGPAWAWPEQGTESGRPNLTDREWWEITDSLVANVASIRHIDGPVRMGLTGGKDSRLCLALAQAADMGDRIQTMTNGPADSPEVEISGVVAEAAGLRNHLRATAPSPSSIGAGAPAPPPPPPPRGGGRPPPPTPRIPRRPGRNSAEGSTATRASSPRGAR
jgi:hypothetical protein